jgi:hypothetical protein
MPRERQFGIIRKLNTFQRYGFIARRNEDDIFLACAMPATAAANCRKEAASPTCRASITAAAEPPPST